MTTSSSRDKTKKIITIAEHSMPRHLSRCWFEISLEFGVCVNVLNIDLMKNTTSINNIKNQIQTNWNYIIAQLLYIFGEWDVSTMVCSIL